MSNLTCNICSSEMKLYHKNLYRLIYYCYNCCNFKCKIYNNNNENIINNNDDKNIFSLYKKYKLNISLFVFYSMFYNQNSYFISDSLDIEWELEKTINYIHKHQTNVNIIYIHCFSYDNILIPLDEQHNPFQFLIPKSVFEDQNKPLSLDT